MELLETLKKIVVAAEKNKAEYEEWISKKLESTSVAELREALKESSSKDPIVADNAAVRTKILINAIERATSLDMAALEAAALTAQLSPSAPKYDGQMFLTGAVGLIPEVDSFVSDIFALMNRQAMSADFCKAVVDSVTAINRFKINNLFSPILPENVPTQIEKAYHENVVRDMKKAVEVGSELVNAGECSADLINMAKMKMMMAAHKAATDLKSVEHGVDVDELFAASSAALTKNNDYITKIAEELQKAGAVVPTIGGHVIESDSIHPSGTKFEAIRAAAYGELMGGSEGGFATLKQKFETFSRSPQGVDAQGLLGSDPTRRMELIGDIPELDIATIRTSVDLLDAKPHVHVSFDWVGPTVVAKIKRMLAMDTTGYMRELASMQDLLSSIEKIVAQSKIRESKIAEIKSRCVTECAEITILAREFETRRNQLESMGEIISLHDVEKTIEELDGEYADLAAFKVKLAEDPEFKKSSWSKILETGRNFERKTGTVAKQLAEREHVSANVRMLAESAKSFTLKIKEKSNAIASLLSTVPPAYSSETAETMFKFVAAVTTATIFSNENRKVMETKGADVHKMDEIFEQTMRALQDFGMDTEKIKTLVLEAASKTTIATSKFKTVFAELAESVGFDV